MHIFYRYKPISETNQQIMHEKTCHCPGKRVCSAAREFTHQAVGPSFYT